MPEDESRPQPAPEEQPVAPRRAMAEEELPTATHEREPQHAAPAPAELQVAPAPAPASAPAPQGGGFRLVSDLNLNGPVPARIRPNIGEWGPAGLPSTKQKKRMRWLTVGAFCLALFVLAGFFWLFYRMLS